ncbi:nitrilase-related carbon-nitrogen hydrolase [Calderihabitans maritimus]|uniref:Nitrilase/cyanide hydratase and apolipoprotein N-acyltransferase n=1 Tax=Calderihabitans maritimus TaxID=1246530 RepID=A0A1Z5HQZ4_9FIRM|nr:nitrilase-related carbon-nitrogen hydrolase [Calderihabitans maritimus]GAW91797.1 Nitrilase/cyanide hydratase and apolipoprotein N-acyltransferase [Calderihabitans maritimus]
MKRFKVAAVQLEIPWGQPRKLLVQCQEYLELASRKGCHLVALPPLTWLGLMEEEELKVTAQGFQGKVALLERLEDKYEEIFSELAREFSMYLVAGTVPVMREGGVFHLAVLYGPEGKQILGQMQTHLSREEEELGFNRGVELETAETEIGRIGLVVGTDVWYPEVSRILTLQGAELLVALTAVAEPYNPWVQLAGMWQEVQQNQVFAVESPFTGRWRDCRYAGCATIYAPCEITEGEQGFLAKSDKPTGSQLVVGELAWEKLKQIRESYPIYRHFNRRLYKRELAAVYGEGDGC